MLEKIITFMIDVTYDGLCSKFKKDKKKVTC